MTYMCLQNPHSFMKYIYDPENGGSWVLQPTVSHLPGGDGSKIGFTYVLAAGFEYDFLNTLRSLKNGSFSEPSEIYPYFTQVAGRDFGVGTVYHQKVDGETVYHHRCYDWWLGIKGDDIPPWPPGTGEGSGSGGGSSGSGGDSSSGSSGGSSGSGGDSGSGSSGGSSSGGGDSGSGSSGGSSSGGGDSGGGSSGGSSNSGGDSSGGSSSDKGGPPDTWFPPEDDLPKDPWEFFDPFKPQTPPIDWDDNYDPRKPGDPIYDDYDPFAELNRLLQEIFGG